MLHIAWTKVRGMPNTSQKRAHVTRYVLESILNYVLFVLDSGSQFFYFSHCYSFPFVYIRNFVPLEPRAL